MTRAILRLVVVFGLVVGAVQSLPEAEAQAQTRAGSNVPEPLFAPDGLCSDESNRFVDCLNGTVIDTVTGLVWLQYADCLMDVPRGEASAAASELGDGLCGLTDGSSQGDWRLPTQAEFEATMAPAVAAGCSLSLVGGLSSLADRTADSCWQELEQSGGGDASGWPAVVSVVYLAGTEQQPEPSVTWLTFLGSGESNFIGSFGQGLALRVWPVRAARP